MSRARENISRRRAIDLPPIDLHWAALATRNHPPIETGGGRRGQKGGRNNESTPLKDPSEGSL